MILVPLTIVCAGILSGFVLLDSDVAE